MVFLRKGSIDEDSHLDEEEESFESDTDGEDRHGKEEVLEIARTIFRWRWFFVFGWPVLAILMGMPAWMLLDRAIPMSKTAPANTPSTQALAVFEEHFEDLAIIRRELVVFRCKAYCDSAASDLSRGFVEEVVSLVKHFDNTHPGSIVQVNSYFTFAGHHQLGENPMLSKDRQSILVQWLWRVTPEIKGDCDAFIGRIQDFIDEINMFQGPDGLSASSTGLVTLDHTMRETLIEEIPVHEISTIWLPFIILALALRSPRMLLLALIPMPLEILTAFGLMYFVSLQTDVLFYALMMMLMLCTSLSFDYSLFTLTRYAEERAAGESVQDSILKVVSQSGRVVVVSGCVLMIAWASMLGLPAPFNTFCVSACSMIFVCVCVQLTFVPSLLGICPFLGPSAGKRPARVLSGIIHGSPSRDLSLADDASVLLGRSASDPMAKAQPHMRGIGFTLGKWLTKFPFNILVPLVVYAIMMPLTLRMCQNFDFTNIKFQMGHSFELTVPRGRKQWTTALEVQNNFPSEVGILMPMLIIATNEPHGDDVNNATAAARSTLDVPLLHETTVPPTPVDVRGEHFFNANCAMVNAVIDATRNSSFPLGAHNFVSATFHGEENGGVKCLNSWEVDLVRTNPLLKRWFLSHTSKNLEMLWHQLVSKKNDAMLTFVFPTMDPFSPEAFDLVDEVRGVLRNQTLEASIPGLTFKTFSPASILMDLIDVTSHCLPLTFLACVVTCLTLVAFWFGAPFLPLKLLLTVAVPITWTYGAALYVYQDGVFTSFDFMPPGLSPTGNAGIDWTVPIFTLTFIVGLAMDYEIFLIERIREFREEGFGERESIQLGLAATGDTITCAGLIMALTFVAQLLGSIPVTNQMGFILVFSIIVDTFVVRTILVPAMLSLVPRINHWPSKMPPVRYTWLQGCCGDHDEESSSSGSSSGSGNSSSTVRSSSVQQEVDLKRKRAA